MTTRVLLIMSLGLNLAVVAVLWHERLQRHARAQALARAETALQAATRPPPPPPTAAMRVEPLARFTLCSQLTSAPEPPASLGAFVAVPCQDHVDLLAFDRAPERIAHIALQAPEPELHFQAATAASSDIDADGLPDLLLGFAYADASGSPRGGALYQLTGQRAGGLSAPRLLLPLTVGSIAAAPFDALAGDDLAVLQLEDPRLGRSQQAVLMLGGPAPRKLASVPLPDAARALAAIDLDLDGRFELLVTGPELSPELWYLDAQGAIERRVPLELPAGTRALLTDIDGDGHRDALLYGARLDVLLAAAQAQPEPRRVLDALAFAPLGAADVDADGRTDLIGLRENELSALLQLAPLHFEQAKLMELASVPVRPIAIVPVMKERVVQRLALFGQSLGHPGDLELGLMPVRAEHRQAWSDQTAPVSDAALALHWALR